jgi:two-component system, sensor histidine kinase ChiS
MLWNSGSKLPYSTRCMTRAWPASRCVIIASEILRPHPLQQANVRFPAWLRQPGTRVPDDRSFRMKFLSAVAVVLCSLGLSAETVDPLVERCRSLQQQPKTAIEACEAAFARHAGDIAVDIAQEMLFRRSDAEMATGDFSAAQASLERAAVLPGADEAWMNTYRLQRRQGILAYRRGQFVQALATFRSARDLAASNGDAVAEGHSWNDLGNALRRIGSYREALEAYLASLQKKRSVGDTQLGGLMTNLGDLYRDLNDSQSSRSYYLQALDLHRQRGRTLDVAHTHESLATLALDTRDFATAQRELAQAAAVFHSLGARSDELRIAARAARLGMDSDNVPAARTAIAHGQQLAQVLNVPISPDLALERARLALHDDDAASAEAVLSATLAGLTDTAPERVALLRLRAAALVRLGRSEDAYAQALLFQQADAALRDAEHDRRLEQLRVRFEVAEKERALETLGAEAKLRALALQQRTTQLELVAVAAVLGIALIGFLGYRSRERQRVAAARREARLQAEAERYRDAAAALADDMRRVQSLLDRSDNALVALDLAAGIVAVNRAAATALRVDAGHLRGRPLEEFIDAASAKQLSAALARIEDGESSVDLSLTLHGDESPPWPAKLMSLEDADGASTVVHIIVGTARDAVPAAMTLAMEPAQPVADATISTAGQPPGRDEESADMFRRELVELMVSALTAWEGSTRSGAIELAEKSRVWRVAIDDGRLRVRAMERYLHLARIPRYPRWREVLRTAFYVLAEAPLDADQRNELRRRCDSVQALVRRRALA